MEGLDWQLLQLAFGAGLNQKFDSRALLAPELVRLTDAEFEKLGGLQTRKPFETATGALSIVGGGSISASDVRRHYPNGDEIVLFTKDSLYSRNVQQSGWMLKGTHLAVKVDEQPRFVTTGDQVDCDRAELNGTIVYAWVDGSSVYVAAVDKVTGAVITGPTAMSTNTPTRPRLLALSTKILLFTYQTSGTLGLVVRAIDPANVATGIASAATAVLTGANANSYYDVCRVASTDTAAYAIRRTTTTSYDVGTVTATLAVTTSTKARTSDGAIAVSVDPTGTSVQVIRLVDTGGGLTFDVRGDLIAISGLVDTFTSTVLESAAGGFSFVNNIAAAHRSVQNSSKYRCYYFRTSNETETASKFPCRSGWIDTGNSVGAPSDLTHGVGLASRAFDYDGRIYFWTVFAGRSSVGFRSAGSTLQNTYFLYRDDGFLVSKAAYLRAGGLEPTLGHLPGVALTSGSTTFSWCGTERRIVPVGVAGSDYSDRGPRDISFTFDSNEARRCVRFGQTLYVGCGEGILAYDGAQLVELGFHTFPWSFAVTAAAGALVDGDYGIKATQRWQNAVGETERSTSATTAVGTVSGGPAGLELVNFVPLFVTHKTSRPVAIEVWRTAKNPTSDSPFYLVTDNDPANATNPNRYLPNDTSGAYLPTFDDALVDADATVLETNPENGGVLESIAPPACRVIAASDTRLFIAGIAGEPDRVWYSKQRADGELAAFHDALAVLVPPLGGDITAIAVAADGTPVVFRETATYVLLNDGFDNAGGGQNYVARCASPELGAVNQESLGVTDEGILFKSSRGWRLLNRALSVEDIGEPVVDYNSETPLAVDVIPSQNQVRVLTSSRMLVFDAFATKALGRATWAEWTISDGVHSCVWRNTHVYMSSTAGLKQQRTDWSGVDYGMDIETAWIKFNDLQGFARLRRLSLLGEHRSTHSLRLRLARDYATTDFQDKTWVPSPAVVGGPLQVKHGPKYQQMQALKLRITVVGSTGEALKLTGVGLEVGVKRGLRSNLAAAQKQ